MSEYMKEKEWRREQEGKKKLKEMGKKTECEKKHEKEKDGMRLSKLDTPFLIHSDKLPLTLYIGRGR